MRAKVSGSLPFQFNSTIAPAAPASAAASTKLCPSKFSPRKAKNNSPRLSVRESVLIFLITAVPSPQERDAPANFAISEIGSGFMAGGSQTKTLLDGPRSRAARLECRRTGRCDPRTPDNFRAPCPRSRQCRAPVQGLWRDQLLLFDRSFFHSDLSERLFQSHK